jgi:MSHA pilin protein MshA
MKVLNNNANHQQGFTLIELVIVIVILGILAATAAPKFIDLQVDARNSAMEAVEGAIESQATIVQAKAIVSGLESNATAVLAINGVDYALAYGYPTAEDVASPASAGMATLLKEEGFSTIVVAGDLVYYRQDEPAPTTISTQCTVVYKTSTAAHLRPVVTLNPCT